ncbi:MAG: TolC family protein [Betaproteobacteria bacterium]
MAHGYLNLLSGLTALVATSACSTVAYAPRPLDPATSAAQFQARSVQVDGLKSFAEANGYPVQTWPPAQWGLRELTLTALYFNPGIGTARSRAAVARAELHSAVQPPSWSTRLKPEYHSRSLDSSGPWTLGLELEIPLVAQSKREARAERSAFLADAADLDIASAAWKARSDVRDHYLALRASHDALGLLDAQLAARSEMLALVEKRLQAGMLSARDVAVERIARLQLDQARHQLLATRQRLKGELAGVLGLPAEMLDSMTLQFEAQAPPVIDLDAGAVRRLALRNRLDVHRKLLEFGAADAGVKAAVAAQNPDITLGPGYVWDQGDNVWSLAVGLTLPSTIRAQATIREAQARRDLAVEEFAATQYAAIGIAVRAIAQYHLAREFVNAADQALQLQRDQEARINRQFESGTADRMQRLTARIETLAAEAALNSARDARSQALADLEDAVQRPLFGDFDVLPDASARRSADLAVESGGMPSPRTPEAQR